MRIVSVVGARPQFIKAAVLSRLIREQDWIEEQLVHTGQHYDANMSDVFFTELEIPQPAYHLGIGSGPHGQQTGRMLEALEKVFQEASPDMVMVYGDTNSTLAGALAAVKLHLPVVHIEAGLRSFNRRMPEEINRLMTDHLSTWLFAPTETAVHNLRNEGIPERSIHLVGDVMYDAALDAAGRTRSRLLRRVDVKPKGYVLATIHRAENTDDPLRLHNIFQALRSIAGKVPVVLPLHPRTRAALERQGDIQDLARGICTLEPLGYLDMAGLEANARLIVTDSGGVQKEAFFHRVPCITLRDETEWVELLQLGWNRLADPGNSQHIEATVNDALRSEAVPPAPADLYGGGRAAIHILNILRSTASKPFPGSSHNLACAG